MSLRTGLLSIGAFGFAAQILLLRELFAAFSGNELTTGLIIGIWILGEALGALAGTYLKISFPLTALVSVLLTLAGVAVTPLAPRWFGLLPAETPTVLTLVAITGLISLLPAFSHGLLFTLGAHSLGSSESGASAPANAYLWEGLGSVLGAAAVSFWLLGRLGSLNLLALFGLLVATAVTVRQGARPANLVAGTITALGCLLLLATGRNIERWVYSRLWQHQQIKGIFDSHYGRMLLLEQEEQRILFAYGTPVFTSPPSGSAASEELVHIPLLAQPEPKRVLILGSAYPAALSQALRQPVEQVTLVQPDPVLNRLLLLAGDSTLRASLNDPRTRLFTADPRAWLKASADTFDCIILTEPAPTSLAANRLFTAEFYRLCLEHLAPRGILASPAPGSISRLTHDAASAVAVRQQTLRSVFPQVKLLLLDFPLLLAARDSLHLLSETLSSRFTARQLNTTLLDSGYIAALLDPFRQSQLHPWLPPTPAPVNRDLLPVELRLSMTRAGQLVAPSLARFYRWLGERALPKSALALLLIVPAVFLALRGTSRQFGIFTSGFAGAALTTLLVYCYAVRFGSAYTKTALLVGTFMTGSVAGAGLGRIARRYLKQLFFAGEFLLLLAVAALPLLVRNGTEPLFLGVAAAGGAAVGLQFALASRLAAGAAAAGTAGRLYMLDLTGGCLGGIFTALLLAPVWGIAGAVLVVLLVKLASLLSQLLGLLGQAAAG